MSCSISRANICYMNFTSSAGWQKICPLNKGFPLSAALESFAVHLRNLIDFFYKQPQPPDDVAALDFYDPPTGWAPGAMSPTLEVARERANKEISHITFKRKSGMTPDKPWAVGGLFNEIHVVAQKFASGASPKKLHQDVITWLNSPPATRMTLLVGASTAMTNTASVTLTTSSSGSAGGRKSSMVHRFIDFIVHR